MAKKLLIIEDDRVLNEMYTLKFEKEWYEVESAYEWLEWLNKIITFNPDVILLDLMMPTMNWFETLESIKNNTSSTCKIIIFTNIIDNEKKEKAIQMWADEYLIKANTTPKEAYEVVENILNNKAKTNSMPIYIRPGLNVFKMKNPLIEWWDDIEISINIKI